jgi:hypothetical protein
MHSLLYTGSLPPWGFYSSNLEKQGRRILLCRLLTYTLDTSYAADFTLNSKLRCFNKIHPTQVASVSNRRTGRGLQPGRKLPTFTRTTMRYKQQRVMPQKCHNTHPNIYNSLTSASVLSRRTPAARDMQHTFNGNRGSIPATLQ